MSNSEILKIWKHGKYRKKGLVHLCLTHTKGSSHLIWQIYNNFIVIVITLLICYKSKKE